MCEDWMYAGLYRYCVEGRILEYKSCYAIDGYEGEHWIRVDDVPEAVNEFWELVGRENKVD